MCSTMWKIESEKWQKVTKSDKKNEIKSDKKSGNKKWKKKWKKKWNKKCKFRQVTEQSNLLDRLLHALASAVVWVYKALTFWLFFYNQQFVQDIPVYLGKIYF